ncbi:MAG: NTP transferase domain-containing protein, partial [Lentisphaerae bacterium]|nr:NTP transferase domain-containing protein [Lentisphaerota bacterium]
MATSPKFSIILAAGKGTRMQSDTLHKVCFPIAGVPAINRAIESYNACGIQHHIVVVGSRAGQVVETVGSAFSNVSFVFQSEQLGTANAAKTAIESLPFISDEDDILLVAGDRLMEVSVLERFFNCHSSKNYDLSILAVEGSNNSSQGRILESHDGNACAIIEVADIRQRKAFRALKEKLENSPDFTTDDARNLIVDIFSNGTNSVSEKKLTQAFGSLWLALEDNNTQLAKPLLSGLIPDGLVQFDFTLSGKQITLTPDQALDIPLMNNSVYLAKAKALRYALSNLSSNNAQREEYLSGIPETLAASICTSFTSRVMKVENPDLVMGFNDPSELLAVETRILSRLDNDFELSPSLWFKTIPEWMSDFDTAAEEPCGSSLIATEFQTIYGDDKSVLVERIDAYRNLLTFASESLSDDAPIFIVRSPGRANVMGRHVDHQGGHCNLMTIGNETLVAVRPRQDGTIRLINADGKR